MADSNEWLELIKNQRWSALGTIDQDGAPYVSSVAYCPHADGFLMHLSQLAAHTGYLQSRPACSLLISEPDLGISDPQTLARLTLVGSVDQIPQGSDDFGHAAKAYIKKFPDSEMRFGLGDFHLFHFTPEKGNFVGGFGAAGKIDGNRIKSALTSLS